MDLPIFLDVYIIYLFTDGGGACKKSLVFGKNSKIYKSMNDRVCRRNFFVPHAFGMKKLKCQIMRLCNNKVCIVSSSLLSNWRLP